MIRRRKRCPYCLSLNTVDAMSACKDGSNLQFFYVCDGCDMAWSTDPKSDMYSPPAKREKMEKP